MTAIAAVDELAGLSDAQILEKSGHGRFGPAIVGKAVYDRAQAILKNTDGGRLGPAITDPDYAAKQAAARPPRPQVAHAVAPETPATVTTGATDGRLDLTNLSDPRNPWTYVTLSGAKVLAQKNGVSYPPRVKRDRLIASLQDAGVVPPPVPKDIATDDDIEELSVAELDAELTTLDEPTE